MTRPVQLLAFAAVSAAVALGAGVLMEMGMPPTGHRWPAPITWWGGLLLLVVVWVATARWAQSWRDLWRVTLAQAVATLALAIAAGRFENDLPASMGLAARGGTMLGLLLAYYLVIWLAPVALAFVVVRRLRRRTHAAAA